MGYGHEWRDDEQAPSRCPDCGWTHTRVMDGDVVCTGCGLVLADRVIDDRAEWRTFEGEPDTGNRCGGAISTDGTLPECVQKMLSTVIGDDAGATGSTTVSGKGKRTLLGPSTNSTCHAHTQRLKRLQLQSEERDRTHAADLRVMDDIMSSPVLNMVDDMRSTAMRLFASCKENTKNMRDPLKRATMAVCALYGSRIMAPKSVEAVTDAFGVSRSHLNTARNMVNGLIMAHPHMKREFVHLSHGFSSSTSDALKRTVNKVVPKALRWEVLKHSREIDAFVRENDLMGSNEPNRFAMAIVLLACNEMRVEDVRAEHFTTCCNVSFSTLQKHLRYVKFHWGLEQGRRQREYGLKNYYVNTDAPPSPPRGIRI